MQISKALAPLALKSEAGLEAGSSVAFLLNVLLQEAAQGLRLRKRLFCGDQDKRLDGKRGGPLGFSQAQHRDFSCAHS